MQENPLGKDVAIPQEYAPDVLYSIHREASRGAIAIAAELPFHGADLLTAWDLAWLDASGKPVAGAASIEIPADSTCLIESKSLKLYLNSLANSAYPSADALATVMEQDLSAAAGGAVLVKIHGMSNPIERQEMRGACIDDLSIRSIPDEIDSALLEADPADPIDETLYSHLLRSNCPITNQPDMGSVLIRYSGAKIDQHALLSYLLSYRQHNGFHEACVERIFVDVKHRCAPDRLTVYARYNRRGGIDINPFRSDFEVVPQNARTWRQ